MSDSDYASESAMFFFVFYTFLARFSSQPEGYYFTSMFSGAFELFSAIEVFSGFLSDDIDFDSSDICC